MAEWIGSSVSFLKGLLDVSKEFESKAQPKRGKGDANQKNKSNIVSCYDCGPHGA
jgi:hypothetical protein